MSKGTLGQVVKRAISDAAFRRQLQSNPEGALKGFDLTSEERAALRSGDASKLSTFGVDQRMSKAFTMGEGASAASRAAHGSELSNSSAARAALIDQDSADGSGARSALIDQDSADGSGARSALIDQHDGSRALIGDNAAGGRAALDNSGGAGREGTAYITADEAGRDSSPASLASSDSSANTAFMTSDEMGNDVSASGSSHPSLSADQRLAGETLEADITPTDTAADPWAENPEHQG